MSPPSPPKENKNLQDAEMEDLLPEVSDEQLAKVLEVSLKQFLSERIAEN